MIPDAQGLDSSPRKADAERPQEILMSTNQLPSRPRAEVFIATTVMLSFISFWRAAAIVLSDLASSAYYAGGEAEHYIGKSAPWFILAVMLFSYQ